MAKKITEIEGTWEEIAARAEEFKGRRVRLIVSDAAPVFRAVDAQALAAFKGVLHLAEDPLEAQLRLRDEWPG